MKNWLILLGIALPGPVAWLLSGMQRTILLLLSPALLIVWVGMVFRLRRGRAR